MDALKPNVDACITKRNFLYKLADIFNKLLFLMILSLRCKWGDGIAGVKVIGKIMMKRIRYYKDNHG